MRKSSRQRRMEKMMENIKKDGFNYTYSANEQAEIKRIREKYTPPAQPHDKMKRLRELDASVTRTSQAVSLVFGIAGTLLLGTGMSLCMTQIGGYLGLGHNMAMIIGIVLGIAGGLIVSLAYPVYNAIVKAKRRKLAPEIIRLTDELLK